MKLYIKYILCVAVCSAALTFSVSGDEYTQSLLKKAIQSNDIEGIEELMADKPVNLDEADSFGDTPLIWAVKGCAQKSLQYLIDAKVNLNHQNKEGMTALYHVFQKEGTSAGGLLMAETLLKAGAKIDIPEKHNGWTLYHRIAASSFNTELLTVLLKYTKSSSGNHRTRRRKQIYRTSSVPKGLNRKDKQGNTPLHLACHRAVPECFPIVDALLNAGVQVNPLNNKGETPLDVAKLKIVKNLLLEYEAVHNKKKSSNKSKLKVRKHYYIVY